MSLTRDARRARLKVYAQVEQKSGNQCQALVNIIAKATGLVRISIKPGSVTGLGGVTWGGPYWIVAEELINDLESVLIGRGMAINRGRGPHFAGNFSGSVGFKPEFRDPWNQVQHAAAGLVLGFFHGKPGEWYARLTEDQEQDDLLYEATCPVGSWLADNPKNYDRLSEKMRLAISDGSCTPAITGLLWPPEVYGARLDGR